MNNLLSQAQQIIIENVRPEIEGGRYPVKRIVGDTFYVQADIFRDGPALLKAVVKYRPAGSNGWEEAELHLVNNDLWEGSFRLTEQGHYCYTIEAWTDTFGTWARDMKKRLAANQSSVGDVQEGINLIKAAIPRMTADGDKAAANGFISSVPKDDPQAGGEALVKDEVLELMDSYPDRSAAATYRTELGIWVEREKARFAAWYEMFPRSQSPDPSRSGTFRDVINKLPYVKDLGFDTIYLPPIHPIGRTNRKGPNNTLVAGPNDPGSPWAIGNENGGHKAIEPSLGTLDDFKALIQAAKEHGMEIAMDFAIQCSPDHPWVKAHPEWFFQRPDGTLRYAENPPKKYEDIYPINFYGGDQEGLWNELRDTLLYWCEVGVRTFRVDNPHTKSLVFWEWAIAEVQKQYPDTIYLAEAFTRPKVMKLLAKAGFTQSYTYFTWRNSKAELTEYLTELTQTDMKEYYRGNLWPNTPDILHEYLQHGGKPAFKIRIALASTLSSVYGIYSGYEIGINTPVREGAEEYRDSDKYQINHWDLTAPGNIGGYITRLNQIRRDNPALRLYDNLRFYSSNNDNIIVYGKATPGLDNIVLVVVNLNPFQPQEATLGLPIWDWGMRWDQDYDVTDLLTGSIYRWHGEFNFVRLDPNQEPAHIFLVKPV